MRRVILFNIIFFCFFGIARGQSGELDPSFGNNGIVTTDFGFMYDYNYGTIGRQVLLQPDGTMYILIESEGLSFIAKRLSNGSSDLSYGNNGFSSPVRIVEAYAAEQADGKVVLVGIDINGGFQLARYNSNGAFDNSFSNDGKEPCDFNSGSNIVNAIAIQNDGKIVIGGCAYMVTNWDYAIARFNADGSLDNTFNGSGKQIIDFSGTDDCVLSVALQADGKIIAAGQTYTATGSDFSVARFNADGSLDNTFSNDGLQVTDFYSSEDIAKSLAIQDDGKIIVAGYVYSCDNLTCGNADFAVARYNVNGSLDATFSSDGKQTINFGTYDVAASVALQSDGKIVVAGYSNSGNNSDFAVVRFNKNGTSDNTFNNNGKQTTDFAGDDYGNSIALQGDGKIVVAGWDNSSDFDILRYNTNGSLDNTFDTDGKVTAQLDLKQGSSFYTSAAMQADGKLVTAGYTWNGNNYDFAIARYNTDGTLDNTFSGDGKQTFDFDATDSYANSLAIQADGKIILAGVTASDFALARFNSDGTPDDTFSNDGKLVKDMGFNKYDVANSVALQNDGKILVAGASMIDVDTATGEFISDFVLARFNSDGNPDNTFSSDGIVTTNVGYDDVAKSIAIQADGKIILAGHSLVISRGGDASFFALARYNTNGTIDKTFSNDGKQLTTFADFNYANSVALQSDGKIIVAGNTAYEQTPSSSDFAVARYNIDGSLDNSFGVGGKVTTNFGALYKDATPVIVQTNGRIKVGGGTNGNFTIVSYNADGSLDNSFSKGGIQITDASANDDMIESLVIDNDKLYAVGNGQFPGNLGVVARYLLVEGGPLPIEVTDFTATLKSTIVLLQWQVPLEQNVSEFTIERSNDGVDFTILEKLPSKGNSSIPVKYSVTDDHPLAGINFYRLKMIDADKKILYSKVIAVKINEADNLKIFPNPAKDILFVEAYGNNENATIQILDIVGRKLKEKKIFLNGNTSFSISINNLPMGIHYLLLRTKEKTKLQKFMKE